MQFNWKSFRIHLPSFKKFLDENVQEADGILATVQGFSILSKPNQIIQEQSNNIIINYYNNLEETLETKRFNRDIKFPSALVSKKESMVDKDWSEMTTVERRIVLGLTLEESEIDDIITEFSN